MCFVRFGQWRNVWVSACFYHHQTVPDAIKMYLADILNSVKIAGNNETSSPSFSAEKGILHCRVPKQMLH